jgi:catechol 2,3-dioxygenase-like lactoylglutathione lyase family enzyme
MRTEGSEPSLPARDVARTRAFYESLGFKAGYHDDRYGWAILRTSPHMREREVLHERREDLRVRS